MSKVATAAKTVGGGLSVATLAYLLTLFVTRSEFKRVEDDVRFNAPLISEYNLFKSIETKRVECLEGEVKELMKEVSALKAKSVVKTTNYFRLGDHNSIEGTTFTEISTNPVVVTIVPDATYSIGAQTH
jgi:hypothetical protein